MRADFSNFINALWEQDIVPTLCDYIAIPNVSKMFETDWQANMDEAVALFEDWAREKVEAFEGATVEVIRAEGRTPLLVVDIPGTGGGNAFLYGHLDKQPGNTGWDANKGPWMPVLEDGKLYGRGGADDGYAMFSALSALLALKAHNLPTPRAFIMIEAGEESGSPDLPHYIDLLAERIGTPDVIVCLDSGCGNYDQLWVTTSLRGIVAGTLSIQVLTAGVHSGDASGVVPSSMRILRQLLSRIEDQDSGQILLPEFSVEIPADRLSQAQATAQTVGTAVYERMPFAGATRPMHPKPVELILNRTWRPQLAVIAMDGYPKPETAGNVLLPETRAKLSIRIPPHCDPQTALSALKTALESEPPYGAEVHFEADAAQPGWNAPTLKPWLETAVQEASERYFGKPAALMGDGGAISFMELLGRKYPQAQFMVTGILGPHSNAHGPNEFLHLTAVKAVSASVAEVLATLAEQ